MSTIPETWRTLTAAQRDALVVLARADDPVATEPLGEQAGISTMSAIRARRTLTELGLARETGGPKARATYIELTDEGAALIEDALGDVVVDA